MAITPTGLVMVFTAALLMSAASLLLRSSIDSIGGFALTPSSLVQDILALLMRPAFLLGVLFYGGGTLLWMRVMATEPLSIGYPILLGLAFIILTVGTAFFFDERMTITKLFGMAVIVGGVLITTNG